MRGIALRFGALHKSLFAKSVENRMSLSHSARIYQPMSAADNANRLRREILIRVAKAFLSGDFAGAIDRIPFEMYPKSALTYHCCIYKDRAITRSNCLAAMGILLEEEDDEALPLSHYVERVMARSAPKAPILTVCDIACRGCVPARFFVTNACQSCVARHCAGSCKFGAIYFEYGKAQIDPAKCKNCGRCRDMCPYGAITQLTVPCEKHCPVRAISKGEDGRAEIDFANCTSCGRCMRACPFGAVMERSQIIDVLREIRSGRRVVALAAPALVGQFPATLGQIFAAIGVLGFSDAMEVALGADRTAALEAAEFVERMERGDSFMTTSCCPAYVATARLHAPELLPHISETRTPMHYAAEMAKERHPGCVTVFIGPCVAKRYEGVQDPFVDYVLTFEELGALFVAKKIEVSSCGEYRFGDTASAEARGFALTGGVAGAVTAKAGLAAGIRPLCIDGLSPKGIQRLRAYAKGNCPGNLVEVMTCEGGCVGGAGVLNDSDRAARNVARFIGKEPTQ